MPIPSQAVVAAAVLAAIPFGYWLGGVVAYLAAGPDVGQLPIFTCAIAILASIRFARLPFLKPWTRLTIILGGMALLLVFS